MTLEVFFLLGIAVLLSSLCAAEDEGQKCEPPSECDYVDLFCRVYRAIACLLKGELPLYDTDSSNDDPVEPTP